MGGKRYSLLGDERGDVDQSNDATRLVLTAALDLAQSLGRGAAGAAAEGMYDHRHVFALIK